MISVKSQAISRQGYPATIRIPGRDPSVVLGGNTNGSIDAIPDVVEYIFLFIGGNPSVATDSLSTGSINACLRTAREIRKCEKVSNRSLLTKFSL